MYMYMTCTVLVHCTFVVDLHTVYTVRVFFLFIYLFIFLLSDHKHGGVYSLQVNPYCMRGGGEATPPQLTSGLDVTGSGRT